MLFVPVLIVCSVDGVILIDVRSVVEIEAEYKEEPASAEIVSAFVETSGAKVFAVRKASAKKERPTKMFP